MSTDNPAASVESAKPSWSPIVPFSYKLNTKKGKKNGIKDGQKTALAKNLASASAHGVSLEDFIQRCYTGPDGKPYVVTGADDRILSTVERHLASAWEFMEESAAKHGTTVPTMPALSSVYIGATSGEVEATAADCEELNRLAQAKPATTDGATTDEATTDEATTDEATTPKKGKK